MALLHQFRTGTTKCAQSEIGLGTRGRWCVFGNNLKCGDQAQVAIPHWPVPRSPKPESPCILQPSSCKLPCQITSNYAPKSSSTQINTVVLFSPNSNFYYLNSHRLIQAQSTYHSVQQKACCMVHALDRSQNRINQLRPRNQKSNWIFTKIISHVASIQTKTRRASSSLACRERTSALPPTIRAAPSGGLRLSRLVYLGHLHGNTLSTLRWSH